MKNIFLFIWGVLLVGCGEHSYDIKREQETAKKAVRESFLKHSDDFTSLQYYFKLNHIKEIRISDDKLFIKYIKDLHGSEDVRELQSSKLISPQMAAILRLDTISSNDLLKLKQCLLSIKSDRMQIIESYDEKIGDNIKFFDIRYQGHVPYVNFYYRMFDRNLDFTTNSLYTVPTQDGLSGGVLSKNVIWYYKII